MEKINIIKIEVGRSKNIVDMGDEGEGAVEDDTHTFDLRGERDRGIIDHYREIYLVIDLEPVKENFVLL